MTANDRSPKLIDGPALVVGGVAALEGGAAIASTVIPRAGILGMVTVRLAFGSVGLLAIARSKPRLPDRRSAALVVLVGSALAVHHLCFYESIHRLPLGVAVTLEYCGPLAVALIGSQRRIDLLWAGIAALGAAAAAGIATADRVSVIGVLSGLAAGVCWAGYILAFPVLASRTTRSDGLAMSTSWAAVVVVPAGLSLDNSRILTLHVLVLGLAVAVLSDVIAYSLQSEALRHMPGSLFSILTSTEPAVGAIFGLVALGQRIGWLQWAGIVAVVVASVGAVRSHR
jgi:inner membrane transporter RhtA